MLSKFKNQLCQTLKKAVEIIAIKIAFKMVLAAFFGIWVHPLAL